MYLLPLDIYFEIVAFIVSALCYSSIRDKPLMWFIPFLLFIVIVEIIGSSIRQNNSWLYNISVPIEYFFYTFIFYSHFRMEQFKKIAKSFLFIILIATLVNRFLILGFYNVDSKVVVTNTLIIGSSIMIILCCLYFIELFKRDEEIKLLYDPLFWISMVS